MRILLPQLFQKRERDLLFIENVVVDTAHIGKSAREPLIGERRRHRPGRIHEFKGSAPHPLFGTGDACFVPHLCFLPARKKIDKRALSRIRNARNEKAHGTNCTFLRNAFAFLCDKSVHCGLQRTQRCRRRRGDLQSGFTALFDECHSFIGAAVRHVRLIEEIQDGFAPYHVREPRIVRGRRYARIEHKHDRIAQF